MIKIEPNNVNKKAAIVSLGPRIGLDSVNMRSIDLLYSREYILNVLKREQVDFISKKTKKEKDISYYKDTRETDYNDYDEIYIYNASINPFGGMFDDSSLDTFEKLYSFKGDIIYIITDPKMPPTDFSSYLKSRDKEKTYTFKCNARDKGFERKISSEILDNWREKVWKRIKIAYHGYDYSKYAETYNVGKRTESLVKSLNEDAEWFNFWIYEFCAVNEELDLKLKDYVKISNPYELMYFGNDRHNERNKIVKQFYDIPEFKKLFLGYDPGMKNTDVRDYVKHKELFRIMGEECLCTLVVGDNLHKNNGRTARFFEAMMVDIVAFIWIEYDPEKQYVNNEFLKDFVYVSSKDELRDKINQIKNDSSLYKKIIELERKDVIDSFGYMKMGS